MSQSAVPVQVLSIQVGRVAPLGPDRVPSAFVKTAASGRVPCGPLGLEGDEHADPRVHGGPEKAVYAYAVSNYPIWLASYPQHAALLKAGAFGENLTVGGCNETSVYIDDIVLVGSVVLQVSQPRQPCFKFGLRFADESMPNAMARNGLCGWYYRVLAPGEMGAGDDIELQERPSPDWPIERVNRLIVQRRGTREEREAFAKRSTAQLAPPIAG